MKKIILLTAILCMVACKKDKPKNVNANTKNNTPTAIVSLDQNIDSTYSKLESAKAELAKLKSAIYPSETEKNEAITKQNEVIEGLTEQLTQLLKEKGFTLEEFIDSKNEKQSNALIETGDEKVEKVENKLPKTVQSDPEAIKKIEELKAKVEQNKKNKAADIVPTQKNRNAGTFAEPEPREQ